MGKVIEKLEDLLEWGGTLKDIIWHIYNTSATV